MSVAVIVKEGADGVFLSIVSHSGMSLSKEWDCALSSETGVNGLMIENHCCENVHVGLCFDFSTLFADSQH